MSQIMKYDWEHEACQYVHHGTPGIHLEQHDFAGSVVDCLLYRDSEGLLVGILNHFNEGNPLEKPGAINLWVKPDHQRQGIATALLRDAWHRWTLTNEPLTYTPEGDAWVRGMIAKGQVDPGRTKALDEEIPSQRDVERWWED
jgi:GNAT superfamily N-acetyltransferase